MKHVSRREVLTTGAFVAGVTAISTAKSELATEAGDRPKRDWWDKDCLFVDLHAAYDNAAWLVHHDAVHANDPGHRVVANQIFNVLAANGSGLAKETQQLEQHIPGWRDESVLRKDAR
jgi:hypothetical protein